MDDYMAMLQQGSLFTEGLPLCSDDWVFQQASAAFHNAHFAKRNQAGACVSLHVHPGGENAGKSATRYNPLGVLRWQTLT